MQISLIQVPYMVGDDRHSSSDGPQHLLQNGAANIFTSNGFTVSVDQVERGTAYRDSATASLAVNKNLKKTVNERLWRSRFPSCSPDHAMSAQESLQDSTTRDAGSFG